MSRSNARRLVLRALAAHERWPLSVQGALAVGLFLVAFSVRSLHAVDLAPVMESRSQPGVRMATRYDAAADAILRGEGVFFPEHVDPHDTALLARPPGYPLLLAGIYSGLGRSFYAVGVVQNVVDSLAVLVLFFVGSRVVSYRVGLVAALLLALGHFSAFYANLITPDTLCVLPILLAVAVLVRARPRRPLSFLPYCAAGIL
ncbi:MAG TPA: glycosyltransferase family 39 protein, partial [Vicinamibacteria bacterium]|nr:glycosyltransferase family 39 protein [Vicinamibacteria bacterium]